MKYENNQQAANKYTGLPTTDDRYTAEYGL